MPYPHNLSLIAIISAAAAAWHWSSGNVNWAIEDWQPRPPLQPHGYSCTVEEHATVCHGVVDRVPAYLPGDVNNQRQQGMIQSNVDKLCNLSYDPNKWLSLTNMVDSNGSSLVHITTYDCDKTTLRNNKDTWVLPVDPSGPMGSQVLAGSNLTISECMSELAKKTKCQWLTTEGGGTKVQRTTGFAMNRWQFVPSCNTYIVPVTNDFCPRHLNYSQATAKICAGHVCGLLEKKMGT